MFDYNIFPENSSLYFKDACQKIEQSFPNAVKQNPLIDVDGSIIQTYSIDHQDIDIYDDYDVGAVYVKSEIDLSNIFS